MFKKKIVAIEVPVIAIALAGFLLTLLASGTLVASKTISSSGVIATANLGVYTDSACTQPLTSIDWGVVSPGGSVTKTFYVKNVGSTQLTLSMSGGSWNPTSAGGALTLTWNRQGTVLASNQVSAATVTLSASSSVTGITTFSGNVVISGTG